MLSDKEFWALSTGLSEPAGAFHLADNLVSNERHIGRSLGNLPSTGGVYIGVGPEQNFSYIARLEPAMAFIIDIRRENRNLHLMYKALFAMSAGRADFVSRLFSREPISAVRSNTTAEELFARLAASRPDRRMHDANVRLIREHLLHQHEFPLSKADVEWIEGAFMAFYSDGPEIHYGRLSPSGTSWPTYRWLMTAGDVWGRARSYLASDEGFAFVKDLHARNLIVPVVVDVAGLVAIHGMGEYVRQHESVVRAVYNSNVEMYLNREQKAAFCGNLAALPHDWGTWFIDSKGIRRFPSKLTACVPAQRPADTARAVRE
jgi:hypothetical protein